MISVKIYSEIDGQSMHDQATIVVDRERSRREARPRNAEIVAEIEAHSRPIPKLQRRPKETLPRPLQTASTTALIALKIGPNSLFKKLMYSLFSSSTFDRLVKKLSEFRGRSLVHRVPPAFRLDCEAIGAGLITNFSLISSNFPLEFRTSTRKNPSKFASIHENWSPILAAIGLVVRFDRLSGGNLSFY